MNFIRLAIYYFVAYFVVKLKSAVRKKKENIKHSKLEMVELLGLNSEVCKAWLRRIVRVPVMSIISESAGRYHMDLSMTASNNVLAVFRKNDKEQIVARTIKIKVRIKNMIDGLKDTDNRMPPPLVAFLKRMITNGMNLPEDYLFRSEKSRLTITEDGSLIQLNSTTQKLLLGNFILSRVLLSLIPRPWDHGMGASVTHGSRTAKNLRVVAAILYRVIRRAIASSSVEAADVASGERFNIL